VLHRDVVLKRRAASAALSVPAALRVSVSATSISAAVSAADAAIGSSRWMSG
jgi:hypothetical protein